MRLSWSSASQDANIFKIYFSVDLDTLTPVYLGGQGIGARARRSWGATPVEDAPS